MSTDEYKKLAIHHKEPKSAVLNLNWDVGTHWVGVKTDSMGIIHYFDPFGVNPAFKIKNRIIEFNNVDYQGLTQSNCGWRVLHWIFST